jgi:putative flippase GtrA/glycosyltransferase involved in cell wall biosynthesis
MTDAALLALDLAPREPATTTVELVVPVHNEQAALESSIRQLHDYLRQHFPLTWLVTIADNASTDRTWGIASRLALELDGVRAIHLSDQGRGRALRRAWSTSNAMVVAYMDVDLSTDLAALLPLVAPLVSGHSDVAIGTRLAAGSQVVRGARREAISRGYNLLLKATLRAGFSDAQCGFKAMRTDVARTVLPMVEDQGWFFDTELLVLAERNGLRIHEVPVDWIDDPDSRVDVVRTALGDLWGIGRMLARFARGERVDIPLEHASPPRHLGEQLVRFASIGIVSTVVFAILFALLAEPLGAGLADVVALTICSLLNTAANRRLTFALQGRRGRARHYGAGLVVSLLPLGLSLATLAAIAAAGVSSLGPQLVALTLVNAVATAARFIALRSWVFRTPVKC